MWLLLLYVFLVTGFNRSWSETTVLVIFAITALLWLFRDPGFIPGWAAMFKSDFVDDGTIVIATSFLLFVLPSRKPEFLIRPGKSLEI